MNTTREFIYATDVQAIRNELRAEWYKLAERNRALSATTEAVYRAEVAMARLEITPENLEAIRAERERALNLTLFSSAAKNVLLKTAPLGLILRHRRLGRELDDATDRISMMQRSKADESDIDEHLQRVQKICREYFAVENEMIEA